jgi:lantibiotic modifying enzyme
LREAAVELRRPELADLARSRLSEIVEEANFEGEFVWDISDRNLNLGLYRGIAGIGYVALRQVDPSLPNILSWE